MNCIVKNQFMASTLLSALPSKGAKPTHISVTNGETVVTKGPSSGGFYLIQLANGWEGYISIEYLIYQSTHKLDDRTDAIEVRLLINDGGRVVIKSRASYNCMFDKDTIVESYTECIVNRRSKGWAFVVGFEFDGYVEERFIFCNRTPNADNSVDVSPISRTRRYVLVQKLNSSGFNKDRGNFTVPSGSQPGKESSLFASMRGVREQTGIELKYCNFEEVGSDDESDCFAITAPVSFGKISDSRSTEDATGIHLDWLTSVGATHACHGHYWVPVSAIADSNYMDFVDGIPDHILRGAGCFNQPTNPSGYDEIRGYVLIYKMM
jgi:hypothetical protein